MKNIFKTIALLLVLANTVYAQQPVNYNLYTINPFLLNPAAMGQNECVNIFLNSNNKWTDIPNAPKAFTLGGHSKIAKNTSLGGMILSDNRSLVNYLSFNGMFAHRVQLDKKQHLSLGVSIGFTNNSLNTERVKTSIVNDPAFQVFNSNRFDVGFGLLYSYSHFKAGLSAPRLFDQFGNYANQLNVSLAYDYLVKNTDWKLTPMLLARNYQEVGLIYDVVGMGTWKETITCQLGFRTDNSLIAGIGFNWKNLNLAYAYQYNTGNTYNAFSSAGTQEIQLAFKICRKATAAPLAEEQPKPKADPNANKVQVHANLLDEKYKNPVAGNIVIKQGNVVKFSENVNETGVSTFFLEPKIYSIEITAKGYVPVEESLDLTNNAAGSEYNYELKPIKLEKGLVFKLKSINFETGSDRLTKSSYLILDKMVTILNDNEQMVLETAGYTDNVGDDNLNLKLSEKRAQAVVNYLLAKGAKPSQLKAVGYGEANPIGDNNTDEGRLQNRRVMFTVLEY